MSLGSITNKFATFGLDTISNDEYILAKITAPGNWSGYVDTFSVSFDNVLGNINLSPDLSSIDTDQTGVDGRLSFGTTNTINNFNNFTGDINSYFFVQDDKKGIFNNNTIITGQLNDNIAQDGNNYPQYAFGSGEADLGELVLYLNDQELHRIDLSSLPYLENNQLNANGSGFTNLSVPSPGRDNNNRPDFSKIWRTSKYVVSTTDQVLGYNKVKVVHEFADADDLTTNEVEWINDDNTDEPDFTNNGNETYNINESQITSTETNYLSGIEYYKSVTNVPYEIQVKNLYKNVYSDSSDAFRVTDNQNRFKIKSLLLEGVNNNTITNNGNHTSANPGTIISRELPTLNAAGDQNEILKASSILEVNYTKSLLNLDVVLANQHNNMNDITVLARVKHPLTAANGKTTSGEFEVATSAKFLQYTVSTADQSFLQETFVNESRRLPDNINYTDQASASGAEWDSTVHLSNGLMVYDEKLRYPSGNFINKGEANSDNEIYSPSGNPDYSSESGSKYFYRIFQNDKNAAKTGFALSIQGDGSTLVDPDTALSNTNIRVSVKLPETDDEQETGYLNVAKDFATGAYQDDDGSLNGILTSGISANNITTNTITLGQKFVLKDEYIILRVEANENWTGYLSNITVDWS